MSVLTDLIRAAACALLLAACSSAPFAPCTVGASVACTCTDGRMGAQICLPDRTLGACTCSGGVDAATPDAGAPIDGGGSDSGVSTHVVFRFTGHLYDVDDAAGITGFGMDAIFSGSYSFETDAVDTGIDPTIAVYEYASASDTLEVTIGGVTTFAMDPAMPGLVVAVSDGSGGGTDDVYYVRSEHSGTTASYIGVNELRIELHDPTHTAITGRGLPAAPPDLAQFEQTTADSGLFISGFSVSDPTRGFRFRGIIETIEIAP